MNNNINQNSYIKKKHNFNKNIIDISKSIKFEEENIEKSIYKTEKDYQNSFADILEFNKKFTEKMKKDINLIIYHEDNNDGLISAYVCWKYLVKDNKKKVEFFGLKPGHGSNKNSKIIGLLSQLKGKNILIVDLSYNKQTLDEIRTIANSLIVIDDHIETTTPEKTIFAGGKHAAVAYVWKFFYPKENIPRIIQYVDSSDRKLFLPFTPHSNYFTLSLGFRFVHNIFKTRGDKLFEVLYELFKNDNPNFFIFIGKYFSEVSENIKNQIAINARMSNFQGYRVGVLNFNAPSLTKPVGRQIITNMKNRGENIDFAVLWGYEYSLTPPAYNVTIIDDHKQTRINMADIAKKLGRISGHPKGGGGIAHEAHFYWSRDIWELFKGRNLL